MFERFFTRLELWIAQSNSSHGLSDSREIYVNCPLPQDALDPKTGYPKVKYPRNKIRTTKYTPINFLPLNIIFQFTNIANSYFLFIIILSAFQIFGVQNPGMQAVPLIVIVVLTAIRDGVEDSRRAISDFEMNSSKVQRLSGIENPNVIEDNIGPWRRFKKSCSRVTKKMMTVVLKRKNRFNDDGENNDIDGSDGAAHHVDDLGSINGSMISPVKTRASMNSHRSLKKHQKKHTKLSAFKPNSLCDPNIQLSYGLNFETTQWKIIEVGDIIKINKNDEIPSDVVVLNTSGDDGLCYVETKNLDGETNLKPKKALKSSRCINTIADIERACFSIGCEPPSKDLYSFRGVLKFIGYESENDTQGEETSEPITIDNLLLRGSVLRNTQYVLAVVVATGDDTKIIMNTGVTPTKKSKMSYDLNKYVVINFILLFIMCFVSGLVNGLFYRPSTVNSKRFFDFKPYAPTAAANGVLSFFVNLIMYQTLVPISLYITVEIIKTIQAGFIYSDVQMYYEKLDYPCVPKSWGISDDLGQIEYIFSDKTGTLTQNVMEFRKCVVGDRMYGLSYTAAQEGLDRRNEVDIVAKKSEMNELIAKDTTQMIDSLKNFNPNYFRSDKLTFISSEFIHDLQNINRDDKFTNQSLENHDFMMCLALCHTAIIEKTSNDLDNDGFEDNGDINYGAESPDEVALVSAARDVGIVFLGKEDDIYNVYDATIDQVVQFQVLFIIPFNSTRKRMSIVLKTPNGEILMLVKGADNVIMERCLPNDPNVESLKQSLIELSNEGLRTLCIGKKTLDLKEFESWKKQYLEASSLLDESRESKMLELSDSFEHEFHLIGATAIEDKLQDGVPDAIASFRKAGIKFWMLTGDKVETAISIGFSCSMLDNSMDLIVMKDIDELNDLDEQLNSILKDKFSIDEITKDHIKWLKNDHSIPKETSSLIIDGKTLTTLFDEKTSEEIKLKFLLICKQCCSVLCCRVSPSQKAEIVLLVKNTIDVLTLAIGDGANDVSMIQAANVGVGIAGEEGRQAAMSSDFAIGQFRFLERLLLVHGRWCFNRFTEVVPCFFYKNVVFVMPLFWYGIFTDFDGTYLYEFSLLMLFNLFFTSLPVGVLGVLDQDVPDYIAMEIPQLYRMGISRGKHKDMIKFFNYMIDGIYQSVICFFWPWLVFHQGNFGTKNGLILNDRFSVGNFSAVSSIFVSNTFILMRQKRWDILTIGLNVLSNALTIIWIGGYSSNTFSVNYYFTGVNCYRSGSFWACVFCIMVGCLLPRFALDVFKVNWFPNDVDIVRKLLNIHLIENRDKDMERELSIAKKLANNQYDIQDEDESMGDLPEKDADSKV